MPVYQYVAKDRTGRTVGGRIDATDERAAAAALRKSGLWPMRFQRVDGGHQSPAMASLPGNEAASPADNRSRAMPAQPHPATPPTPHAGAPTGVTPVSATSTAGTGASVSRVGGVSAYQLAVFFRQLATAVHSGMPLSRCMEILRDQSRGALRRVSCEAAAAVQRGQPLSATFSRYPRVFPPLVLALVRAGEAGGTLDTALMRIAELMERQHELQQRIRQQTLYPKFILAAAVLIPIGTRIFISKVAPGVQTTLGSVSIPVVGGVVVLLVGVALLNRLLAHALWFDWLKLRFPLLGRATHQLALARF
ncbi:MAG: type II secretion system F family protein, partial [Armatimonadota bacterium]|nr:type II secretion system F family protein [Armatimonadota bacterium]